MFIVTFIGTVIAAIFALCGLVGGVAFFLDAEQGMSLSVFLQGFVSATWPLLAAGLQLTLLEILRELHEARLTDSDHAPAPAESPARKPHREQTPEASGSCTAPTAKAGAAPVYFPVRETPQGPRIMREEARTMQAAHDESEHEPAEEEANPESGLTFFKMN